ncbi:MAG TPA: glycosyltransferase [Armatimonadota bacterium]|nr:glycosyltransferase [Armatimonadota bacterium]HQK92812.1 glycosyltransferase [Armatimonadota bacterium]
MSKVTFFNIPCHGHMNPALALAQELVRRGECVRFYCTREFEPRITATGAQFRPYPIDDSYVRPTGEVFEGAARLMEACTAGYGPLCQDLRESPPDYIIHDSVCVWGKILAHARGIPAVCSVTQLAFSLRVLLTSVPFMSSLAKTVPGGTRWLMRYLRARRRLWAEHRVAPSGILDVFTNHEPLNLVYTSRLVQPQPERFDSSYAFVGPCLGSRGSAHDFPWEQLESRRVICISMGTIDTDLPRFYESCVEAFAQWDGCVVMAVGSEEQVARLRAPAHFVIRASIPQLEVLQRAAVLISHGGINSIQEAFWHNVPVVLVPGTAERILMSRQVVRLGAGILLSPHRATPARLAEAVHHVVTDPGIQANVAQVGASLREAGGVIRAADLIEEYKAAHGVA